MITNGQKMIREMFGLFFIFLGLLVLLSLITHNLNDPHFNFTLSDAGPVQNSAGLFGAYLSGFLASTLGLSSYVVPLCFLAIGAAFASSSFVIYWWRWIGFFIIFLCFLTLSEAWNLGLADIQGGGFVGAFLYAKMHEILSPSGSALIWFFALMVAIELSFSVSWISLFKKYSQKTYELAKTQAQKTSPKDILEKVKEKQKIRSIEQQQKKNLPAVIDTNIVSKPENKQKDHSPLSLIDIIDPKAKFSKKEQDSPKTEELDIKHEAPLRVVKKISNYRLPSLDLLYKTKGNDPKPNKDYLENKGKLLLNCLAEFNIQADLVRISPGPVVTMFELKPAPGVKVAKISGLVDDIARSLKAVAIRIQAPIVGTDTVGIEIPNDERASVNYRELVQNASFRDSDSLLTIALGKDISGQPQVSDLSKMPHLLVAGATGAGKSVCLNAIIISFLYKANPDELKFLLVDPKRVEMASFADLPHLVHPVVTDMNVAKNALNWAIFEMERRYDLLASLGVKNISSYNQKLKSFNGNIPTQYAQHSPLPFMVVIIDELADLMLTVGKDAETAIIRLAQLARAAGIHLIIATQRPSVDVVTGLIKANFPCRIAFQVTSKYDARTILDEIGAEHLLGKGDMLFKPSGSKQLRLHGAYVSDEEVNNVVNFWKSQAKPDYQVDFTTWQNEQNQEVITTKQSSELQDDPIYTEAVNFVREQGKISISLLQRRFRIGFNRAAGFVEQMEKDGIVNPSENGKPRLVNR